MRNVPDNAPVVVSGIPRSGTTCVMQMLEAGGMECLVDPEYRQADPDNPRGYYEIDVPRYMRACSYAWLAEAQGKAVKVVAYWLDQLPRDVNVRVIYVRRDPHEVLASQEKMLRRSGVGDTVGITADDLRRHDTRVLMRVLRMWPNQVVTYEDLIRRPYGSAALINHLVPIDLDEKAMADVVDVDLYRNRN